MDSPKISYPLSLHAVEAVKHAASLVVAYPWMHSPAVHHRDVRLSRLVACLATAACTGGAGITDASNAATCQTNQALPGAQYSIAVSRFAFGGTPVKTIDNNLIRWSGPDGAVGISANGFAEGLLNANAPEDYLPPITATVPMLTSYVQDYYASMGVEICQVANSHTISYEQSGIGIVGSDAGPVLTSGPVTVGLSRALDGIPIVESLAFAEFDSDNQTIDEGFYWPTIPEAVVIAAVQFRSQISTTDGLASYLSKLPEDARGKGQVVIHHRRRPERC